jgi:splicing factor 3B subunit 3
MHVACYQLSLFGFVHDNPHRPRKLASARTRFTITCLKTFYTRITVGDCRDGIHFFAYREVNISFSC